MTCKSCGVEFLIINGIKINGNSYCSEICKPKIGDLISKWENELNDINFNIEDYNINENEFINNDLLI